jgi:hypothetical protein
MRQPNIIPASREWHQLGAPYPVIDILIELANGMLVRESVFGKPPPDMPVEEYSTWYADREFEIMCQGDGEEEEEE